MPGTKLYFCYQELTDGLMDYDKANHLQRLSQILYNSIHGICIKIQQLYLQDKISYYSIFKNRYHQQYIYPNLPLYSFHLTQTIK